MEIALASWGERSDENHRRAREDLFSIQNSRKARVGGLAGLLDPKLMARKVADEVNASQKYINEVAAKLGELPAWANDAKAAFAKIGPSARKTRAKIIREVTLPENGSAVLNTQLFGIARTLVRAAEEKAKPSGDRLKEFGDARLPSLEFSLFSDEEIYDDFEILKLADSVDVPGQRTRARKANSSRRSWPASRRANGLMNWSAAANSRTYPFAKSFTKAASRRSMPAPTR